MNPDDFERLLQDTIANRSPFATKNSPEPDSVLTTAQTCELVRQQALDEFISAWKSEHSSPTCVPAAQPKLSPPPSFRRALNKRLPIALAAGLILAVISPVGINQDAPNNQPVSFATQSLRLETSTLPPDPRADFSQQLISSSTSVSPESDVYTTANRLAYAFEPVGLGVNKVVHQLIDSVPGAELFTPWPYDS